ncbi:STAS domain-containing protein [Lentzea sp. CA-135723]|uniref:STAS domain-containing protein n=1 Tax=Lentzea sp. CA-135723 TaxID=3239950 RepID=UPI003D93937C
MDTSEARALFSAEPSPFTLRELPEVTVVELAGELDPVVADRVSGLLTAAVDRGLPVVVDCGAVRFGSSTILGAFYTAHTRAVKKGTRFVLVTDKRVLLRPLAALGLLDAMVVVPDLPAALRELELWDLATQLPDGDR